MTLYDLIKAYGTGNGEEAMWKTIASISEAVDTSMPAEQKHDLMRKVYGEISGHHYNEDFAEQDVKKMFYVDRAGTKHPAPYWSREDVDDIYESVKGDIKGYNACDFYVTMNMVAADNWPLLEKWFPNMSKDERDTKTVELALNWLRDPDATHPATKIWHYMSK